MRAKQSILVLALMASCVGPATTIEQVWTAPQGTAGFDRVVALYDSDDGVVRRTAEDRLVLRLRAQGVRADPSYAILSSEDAKSVDKAKPALRAAGYDGLIVMKVVDREQQIEYSPSYYGGYWGGGWGGTWGYGPYYDPGFAYVNNIVRIETKAYSLDDGKMVFSTLSKSEDVESSATLFKEVTDVVATNLGERGIVASRTRVTSPEATARR